MGSLARGAVTEEHADCDRKQKPAYNCPSDSSAGHPTSAGMAADTIAPPTIPATPPLTLRNTASAKNCSNMCIWLAPTAMRVTILSVLYVTETSTIFAMPTVRSGDDVNASGMTGFDLAGRLREHCPTGSIDPVEAPPYSAAAYRRRR